MQYTLDCITTLLNALLCFLLGNSKFSRSQMKQPTRLFIIAIVVIMKLATIYFRIPPLNLVSSCIMIPIILKAGHKCNYYSVLIYSAIVVMLTMTADALGVLLTSWVQDQTISVAVTEISLSLQRHLINWMLQIIFTRIVILLIKKNSVQSSKWHEAFFYLFLVVFEIGIYIYVSYVIQEYSNGNFLIIMMLGFLVLDLYMIYILHKIASTRETEYQLQLMYQQSNLQLHLYQELQNKYSLSRSVAHDIERHINSLTKLLKDSPQTDVNDYMLDLHRTAEKLRPMIQNQNMMLAIILNTAFEKAEKEKIVLNLDVEDFSMRFMRDMDITTIFSNLLDNAMEACLELPCESREIRFILRKKMNLLVLRIVNPCDDTELEQGIGLANVQRAVEKYGGIFYVQKRNGCFEAAITMPIDEEAVI